MISSVADERLEITHSTSALLKNGHRHCIQSLEEFIYSHSARHHTRQRLRQAASYLCYYGRGGLEIISSADAAILAAEAYAADELE